MSKDSSTPPPAAAAMPASTTQTTQPSTSILPTTHKGIFIMFIRNITTTTIFISANLSMIILANLLQQIADRNFGKAEEPVLWYFVSFVSVMAFSFGTLIAWNDLRASKPSFLLMMAWVYSFVGAGLIAALISAVVAESVVLWFSG